MLLGCLLWTSPYVAGIFALDLFPYVAGMFALD